MPRLPPISPSSGTRFTHPSRSRSHNIVHARKARNYSDIYSRGGSPQTERLGIECLLGTARGGERHPSNLGRQLRIPAADARADYFLAQAAERTLCYIV